MLYGFQLNGNNTVNIRSDKLKTDLKEGSMMMDSVQYAVAFEKLISICGATWMC